MRCAGIEKWRRRLKFDGNFNLQFSNLVFMKTKPENAYLIEWAFYVVLFVGWLIYQLIR
jgi:hypothetical protein